MFIHTYLYREREKLRSLSCTQKWSWNRSALAWVLIIYCNYKMGPEEVLWPSAQVQGLNLFPTFLLGSASGVVHCAQEWHCWEMVSSIYAQDGRCAVQRSAAGDNTCCLTNNFRLFALRGASVRGLSGIKCQQRGFLWCECMLTGDWYHFTVHLRFISLRTRG